MKKKLNCVLLVDDDSDSNFFVQRLLKKMECTEKVELAKDGLEALNFLKSGANEDFSYPSIIFLDINMPRMNGWEFLDEYKEFDEKVKEKIVLIMLTSSLNPDDREKALAYGSNVNGFQNKSLNKEALQQILQQHFADHF